MKRKAILILIPVLVSIVIHLAMGNGAAAQTTQTGHKFDVTISNTGNTDLSNFPVRLGDLDRDKVDSIYTGQAYARTTEGGFLPLQTFFSTTNTRTSAAPWVVAVPSLSAGSAVTIDIEFPLNGNQEAQAWPIQRRTSLFNGDTDIQVTNNLILTIDAIFLQGEDGVFFYHAPNNFSFLPFSNNDWDGDPSGTVFFGVSEGQVRGFVRRGHNNYLQIGCGDLVTDSRVEYELHYYVNTNNSWDFNCYRTEARNGIRYLVGEKFASSGGQTIAYLSGSMRIGTTTPGTNAGAFNTYPERGDLMGTMFGAEIKRANTIVASPNLSEGVTTSSWGRSNNTYVGRIGNTGETSVGVWTFNTYESTTPTLAYGSIETYYSDATPSTGPIETGVEIGIGEQGQQDDIQSFFLDPIRRALEESGLGKEAAGMILMMVLAIVIGGGIYRKNGSLEIFTIVSIIVMALGVAVSFYDLWLVVMYAFGAAGLIVIKTKGVALGGSSMSSWMGVFATLGAVVTVFELIYMGQASAQGQFTDLQTVARLELFKSQELGIFDLGFTIPFINFDFFGAIFNLLTPSFTQFFPGDWRIVALVMNMVFAVMMGTVLIRWITPLANAVTNSIRGG